MTQRASIIIPVYFNRESLEPLVRQMQEAVAPLQDFEFEFIFVDDGSTDQSFEKLLELRRGEKRIKILKLSRNFGSHSAIMAGLGKAASQCQVIMGADLQDPPGIIPQFLGKWKEGGKFVVAIRQERKDPWLTSLLANLYYATMRFTFKNMPRKGFDIFLIDNCVREFLLNIGSRNMSLVAALLWAGYPAVEVPYVRQTRAFGKSRWTLWKRMKLAIDSLTAFSYLPILFLAVSGVFLTILAVLFMVLALIPGRIPPFLLEPRTLLLLCLFGIGVGVLGLGILGEYLWRTLQATRNFPGYLIDKAVGFDPESTEQP
jgi:dolichol-phosphate mannosyltransferase